MTSGTRTSAQRLAPGMDRLLADDGGGVELTVLFTNILLAVHRDEQITLAGARASIARSHAHQFSRMRHLYRHAAKEKEKEEDGVDACLRAILAQMVLRGLLTQTEEDRESGTWRKGPRFALDAKMRVVRTSAGHWITVEIPEQMETELSLTGQIDLLRMDVKAIVSLLEPHSVGFRPLTRDGIDTIKDSLLTRGYMHGYPILYDQHGRLLSGRHRLAAEREMKEEGTWDSSWPDAWRADTIKVENDLEAIGIAMAGNYGRRWTKDDFRRLEKMGLANTQRDAVRRLIVMALEEVKGQQGNSAIARRVGCSHHTVQSVRAAMEETWQIAKFRAVGGRGHTEATPVPPQTQEHEQEHKEERAPQPQPQPQPQHRRAGPRVDEEQVAALMDQGLGYAAIVHALGLPGDESTPVRMAMNSVKAARAALARASRPDQRQDGHAENAQAPTAMLAAPLPSSESESEAPAQDAAPARPPLSRDDVLAHFRSLAPADQRWVRDQLGCPSGAD